MTEFYPNWKTLPVEILHEIFQLIPAKYSYNFSLVCKAWLQPAQAVLYSDVTIGSMLQFKAFQNTIENNSHLGNKIKELELDRSMLYSTQGSEWAEVETFNSLTTLLSNHLPNLEVLNDNASKSYIPVLEALLDSNLEHLRRISTPHSHCDKSEIANYVTCALLMKDRLENIYISDESQYVDSRAKSDRLFFNRLYKQLHQFEDLEELTLEKATNEEIEVLEYVVNTCKSLREITFYFRSENETVMLENNNNVSIERITSFAAKPNIKALTSEIFATSDFKMLLYIMQTFTQLEELSLAVSGYALSQEIFTSLLHYMSRIDELSVTFDKIYAQTITECVNSYWEAASKPGNEYVKYVYTDDNDLGLVCSSFELSKQGGSERTGTIIRYPRFSNNGWEHRNFTERNGEFLCEILFAFEFKKQSTAKNSRVLPEDFMTHIVTNCPNLQHLYFNNCIFKHFTPHSSVDFSKEVSLDGLSLNDCTIYPGVLEQLSLLLKGIKYLSLDNVTFGGVAKKSTLPETYDFATAISTPFHITMSATMPTVISEINMPFTKIDSVLFGNCYLNKTLFLKVFTTGDRRYYYYRYDTSKNGNIEISSAEDFNLGSYGDRIYICSQTVPFFQIKSSE